MLRMSRRDRRALLVGGLSVPGLLFGARGLPALHRWQSEARSSAVELSAELARAGRELEMLPAALDTLEARNQRFVLLAPALLPGDSPAAAGGALASWIASTASQAGADIGAVYMEVDTGGTGVFTRVSVNADLTGDITGVTRFLAALEAGPMLLAFRELSIDQPDAALPDDRMEALRVRLVLEGLALSPKRGDGDAR
jgi:hypothetical protein